MSPTIFSGKGLLTNVSAHGFPWFRHATLAQLSTIERPTHGHLRWPELDVDLTLESMDRPGDFPLVSRKR